VFVSYIPFLLFLFCFFAADHCRGSAATFCCRFPTTIADGRCDVLENRSVAKQNVESGEWILLAPSRLVLVLGSNSNSSPSSRDCNRIPFLNSEPFRQRHQLIVILTTFDETPSCLVGHRLVSHIQIVLNPAIH